MYKTSMNFFDTVFNHRNGNINLTEIDIREGAHLIRVSRKIYQVLVEANEFEKNFCLKNSRIPKTYFRGKGKSLSLKDKAEIYALHYITKSTALAKAVNQSLSRNNSFKAFGLPVQNVLRSLKTRKLVDVYSTGELYANGRHKKKYKTSYNVDDPEHVLFFEKYQGIYPGQVF